MFYSCLVNNCFLLDLISSVSSMTFQVVQLMMLDCKRAVPLFIQHKDLIPPSEVVIQLLNASKTCNSHYFLHLYLHSLFEINPHAGKDYHDMQVSSLFIIG